MNQKEAITPSCYIKLDDKEITFREIHQEFAQCPFGRSLSEKVRWSRYQPKNVNNSEWVHLLGFDANNLEHCRLMYGLTQVFIQKQNQSSGYLNFNNQESEALLLTALVHDWPEAYTKNGDVCFEFKTRKDEEEELSIAARIILSFVGKEGLIITRKVIEALDRKDSKLGMAFNAIEHVGYMRTGINAWNKSKNESLDEKLKSKLQLLTHNVLSNSIIPLIKYSYDYPPIAEYLINQRSIINQGFNLDPQISQGYETQEIILDNQLKFSWAKQNWEKWLSCTTQTT